MSSNPEDRDIDGVETQFDAFDSVDAEVRPLILKPRFGCQVYSEVSGGMIGGTLRHAVLVG